MAQTALIAFHSSEGQTAKIGERVASRLREAGLDVQIAPVESAPAPDGFDVVVLGDPIHATHHSRAMRDYIRQHLAELSDRPSALFQVSLTSANPDEEHTAIALGLVHELLDDTGWDPDIVGMFAGALVYTRYGWIKKRIMRAIVKREGGDTDLRHDHEYTDWDAVDRFADDIAALAAD
jgi:menaquinone-dependent protoporphyrinogen oxidase